MLLLEGRLEEGLVEEDTSLVLDLLSCLWIYELAILELCIGHFA